MKKRSFALLLATSMIASLLGGCASRAKVTEDMIPTVVDLGLDDVQEVEEVVPNIIGLAMNKSYIAELIRLDGDNTQMATVDAKQIPVVLKATSVDKDLKVKIVNKKNDRVITGTKFEVSVTDANNKIKEYSDDDKDGIIYIKEMEPGKCKISMKASGNYGAAADITAEVKANIEYAVIDVADEIKKESEINVSKEDSNTSGNDGAGTAVVLTDTVEFVASTKTEIMRQKVDEFGTPMYEKIISEPERFCVDSNKDSKCDRCGAAMKACTHTYKETITKEATCIAEGTKTLTCESCGNTKTEPIAKDPSKHTFENGKCKDCGAVDSAHTCDTANVVTAATCTAEGTAKCSVCGKESKIPMKEHSYENGTCKVCGAADGHTCDASNVVTAATCQTEGKATCSVCGKESTIAVQEHKFGDDGICTYGCGTTKTVDTGTPSEPQGQPSANDGATASAVSRVLRLVTTAATAEKIVYDTKSAPIMEGTGEYKYTGWQTINNATYYFDKNGKKVTGSQVIQGIQYTFNSEGVRSGTIGIDVSKYQTSVNWTKVKNAGINFVIIRCGYRGYGSGVLVEDPMFASHITGAKAAGLRVGVYFFSQAITEAEAVEEASMAVKLANRYGINMPIAIDSEYAAGGAGRADGLSKSARTKITVAFCNTVKNAGHTPMVYASKSWFSSHLDTSQFPGSYRIWVAHYAAQCGYTGRYDIWQNTSKGKVDGINGNVDMNISSI